MKWRCIICVLCLGETVWGQGTVVFNNRAGSSSTASPGLVIAPIYGPENDNRLSNEFKSGDSVVYTGSRLYAGYLGATWDSDALGPREQSSDRAKGQ